MTPTRVALIGALLLLPSLASGQDTTFRAGFARMSITPELPDTWTDANAKEPAGVEAAFPRPPRRGVVLTLPTFDTPDDPHGRAWMGQMNAWLVIALIVALIMVIRYVVEDRRPLPEPSKPPLEDPSGFRF